MRKQGSESCLRVGLLVLCKVIRLDQSLAFFSRLASQSTFVSLPPKLPSIVPLIVSSVTVPLYLVVTF